MHFSITQKFFIAFAVISFLVVTLGTGTYIGIDRLQDNTEKIKQLYDFKLQMNSLERFHLQPANNFGKNVVESFHRDLKKAEESVQIIKHYQVVASQNLNFTTRDLDTHLTYYRDAALELFAHEAHGGELRGKIFSILNLLFHGETYSSPNQKDKLVRIYSLLELNWNRLLQTRESGHIPVMKELFRELVLNTDDREIQVLVKEMIREVEVYYVNLLAIEDRKVFLTDTVQRFYEVANASMETIGADNQARRIRLRNLIVSLVSASILITLFLWYMGSRRLQRFLKNLRHAIKSIKSGRYDYEIGMVDSDELGELSVFMKGLAKSLQEQISELHHIETEKQSLQNQLYQSQKIESIGMLAGGVAHDFNNLLTSINGYSELALLKLPENDPVHDYLKIIHESGLRAGELTRQLLAFSRKQVLEMKIVNLNIILDNLLKMIARIVGEDIHLEVNKGQLLKNILADRGQIEQVLVNLIVNARDSMPEGGVVRIVTSDFTLKMDEAGQHPEMAAGDYVMVSVKDTGMGFSQEIQDKIFEPFFTTKPRDKGTGLGLATAYGIVRQHGGMIEVFSNPGKGTEFRVYLPAVKDALAAEPEPNGAVPSSQARETLLVVDDESSIRKLMLDTLQPLGYHVLQAASGEEALLICEQTRGTIHLLITDVIMPGMNGKDLAEIIIQERPGIKVTYMSGYSDLELFPEGEKTNGGIVFLQKPIAPSVLKKWVQEILRENKDGD